MDATESLATAILSSPVAGAAGMVIGVVLLQYLRNFLPAFMTAPAGESTKASPEHDPPRGWQVDLREAGTHLEDIGDILKARNDLCRREIEAVERIERLLVELLARERAAARSTNATPRTRTPSTT